MSVQKTIALSPQHESWLELQVKEGRYGSLSALIKDLIDERQIREAETQEHIEDLRRALIEGEASGRSPLCLQDIWLDETQKR
ncbi:type II toxin-antitoxin system ParD family antitoxin [Woodsholea maritima]|uniref:type II toxin-antitoxin system ParD family antitoxin n=1 Tax=Woodsholea maritima TaxID=240237 RepID=UPI00036B45FC|nr:type II toxin-antitoxin system ParD family antitoxin [Woodsholea maritima]